MSVGPSFNRPSIDSFVEKTKIIFFIFCPEGRKYAMLKLKILLSTILRSYKVYSDLKEDDFKLQADIILKREEGFMVRLQPRQQMAKA